MSSVCDERASEIVSFVGGLGVTCSDAPVEVLEQGSCSNNNSSSLIENGLQCTNNDLKKGFTLEAIHSNLLENQTCLTTKPFVGHMQDLVSYVEATENGAEEKAEPPDCETCTDFNGSCNSHSKTRTASSKSADEERPHFCVECNKNFKLISQLKIHERIHSNERPYLCEYCQKGFKQPSNLTQHRRIHTGERPYRCAYCEKTFKQKSQVMQHERLHTGAKPYVCKQCQRGFVQLSQLQSHEKTHRDRAARLAKKGKIQVAKDELNVGLTSDNLVKPVMMN